MAVVSAKKVAILGSGYGFTEIFPVLNSFSDIDTVLKHPRDPSAGLRYSLLERVELLSLGEILENQEIDLVFIALPPSLHLEYFRILATSGKTVYLEKPAGLSENQAVEIARIARQSNTDLYIGFQFRFDPGLEFFAKETQEIRRNDSNFNITVNWQIAESKTPKTGWKNEINMGGGVFRDHLCHVIDYLRYSFEFRNDEYILNELELVTQKSDLLHEVILKSDRINIEIKRGAYEKSYWSISVSDGQSIYKINSAYPFDLDSYKFETGDSELDEILGSRWIETKNRFRSVVPDFNSRRHALRAYLERVLHDEDSVGAHKVRTLPTIYDAIFTQKIADKLIGLEDPEF